jgi:hypothetical protein
MVSKDIGTSAFKSRSGGKEKRMDRSLDRFYWRTTPAVLASDEFSAERSEDHAELKPRRISWHLRLPAGKTDRIGGDVDEQPDD